MKLLFVADPLATFKTHKDSTFAMMREAARRGHEILACESAQLHWQRGGRVSAPMLRLTLTGRSLLYGTATFPYINAPNFL